MSQIRPFLVLLAFLAVPHSRLAAQQNDAEKKEAAVAIARADSTRATLVQPPGSKGVTAASVVRSPFKFFAIGVGAVAGVGYLGYAALEKSGVLPKLLDARRSLEANDVHVRPKFIGKRSGPALTVRWDGLGPLFVETGISTHRYTLVRGGLAFGDKVTGLEVGAARRRMNQIHFWGLGPESVIDDQSDYALALDEVTGSVWKRLAPRVRLGLDGGWEQNTVGRGKDANMPDLQDQFAAALPFGAQGRDRFGWADAVLDLDGSTMTPELQVRGVRLITRWAVYRGLGETDSDFQQGSADLRIYLPVTARHSFAVRGMAADAFAESGQGVPFYHMATLGDDKGLRGLKGWRLRDNAVLAAQAEWRYRVWWQPSVPNYRVDGFAFVDHATVGSSLSAIHASDFRTTPGFGLRLIRKGATLVEGYAAFGGDRPRVGGTIGATF